MLDRKGRKKAINTQNIFRIKRKTKRKISYLLEVLHLCLSSLKRLCMRKMVIDEASKMPFIVQKFQAIQLTVTVIVNVCHLSVHK